ncbi:MAG TPA: ABC transporter ATP-binding protein [Gaiellaceae bacterium]|nr:ABC transporter ATP-binding protein [Gaiellaceae bacterium]
MADTVAPAIETLGITKRFPGVLANDAVDFSVRPGEVHALLGENGAGKTTLSHVLTGLYHPDEGEIRLFGEPVSFTCPRDAIDAGVCMVHQHFRLVERFTVAENLVLGDTRGAGKAFLIDPDAVEGQVRELGKRYRLEVDPHARVWQLGVGEQQRVEILNALYQDAKVLLLDEPTAVLTPDEADSLFETLRQIAAEGRTVVFISHKLHEVMAVSDRVTVLRAGKLVGTVNTKDATPQSLTALMVGHELDTVSRTPHATETEETMLQVDDLWADNDRGAAAVKGVSLSIHAGEIVALAGVAGNGQRELAEAITGLRPHTRGTVKIAGKALHNGDVRAAFDLGVRYVPEDRLGTGVSPSLSLAWNLALRAYRKLAHGPVLPLRRMRETAVHDIEEYDIKASSPDMPAVNLSGGNLQKLVLAREFHGQMKLLVVASPTRGLDVSAVETVHQHLLEAAEHGAAVLLISEDLDEILALNDRVIVMYEGELSDVADRESIEEIGLRMAGGAPETPPAPQAV